MHIVLVKLIEDFSRLKGCNFVRKAVTYPEFSWAERYIHGTHKGATMVSTELLTFQNLCPRCPKNALPGPVLF